MALGLLKRVGNMKRRFGSSDEYWFLKVQSDYGHEEYWLLTDTERAKFKERSCTNIEDVDLIRRRGVVSLIPNSKRLFGSEKSYFGVSVQDDAVRENWFITVNELERVRSRSESNAEDIEANREGWLADLLD